MQAENSAKLQPSNNISTKVSVLEQELQALEESVNFLNKAASNLEERLKPLTLLKGENIIDKEASELRSNSPVVARIRNQSLRISSVTAVINNLQDNLEI